jgi:hypothetical protein
METLETTAPTATLTPPKPGQPWPEQGGIYGGILPAIGDQPAMHMVFSVDEAEALEWGEYGTLIDGAASRYNGKANTAALLASITAGKTHPATTWATNHVSAEGHQDFHLPSQAELFMASLHATDVFNKRGWYWSSTQDSAIIAFVQDFAYGSSFWSFKGNDYRVRAVRWIHVNP